MKMFQDVNLLNTSDSDNGDEFRIPLCQEIS